MRGGRRVGLCALVLVVLGAAAACGSGSGSSESGTVTDTARGGPLEGRWTLDRYAVGGRLTAPPAGVAADAVFEGGRVSGRAPVNRYSGSYTADAAGALAFGPVATTQMAGTPQAEAAERAFLAGLAATAAYGSRDGALTLLDAAGAPVLTFTAAPATLAGSWEVTGYNNGREAVVSVVPGSTITADFAEDGTLTGDAGINTYRSTYTTTPSGASGLTIAIAPPAATRKAGPEDLMRQEQEFLAALESARTVTFDGGRATLRDASDAIAVTLSPG